MNKKKVLVLAVTLSVFAIGAGSTYAEKKEDAFNRLAFVDESEQQNKEIQNDDQSKTALESENGELVDLDELLQMNEEESKRQAEVAEKFIDEKFSAESSKSSEAPEGDSLQKIQKLIQIARAQIGKPYSYGSTGPYSFDCSGFTTYVYRQIGISLPRVASSQAYGAKNVSKSELRTGDLVFFNTYGGISHVGLYIGDGAFIHASSYGSGVRYDSIYSKYYASRYVTAARYL